MGAFFSQLSSHRVLPPSDDSGEEQCGCHLQQMSCAAIDASRRSLGDEQFRQLNVISFPIRCPMTGQGRLQRM